MPLPIFPAIPVQTQTSTWSDATGCSEPRPEDAPHCSSAHNQPQPASPNSPGCGSAISRHWVRPWIESRATSLPYPYAFLANPPSPSCCVPRQANRQEPVHARPHASSVDGKTRADFRFARVSARFFQMISCRLHQTSSYLVHSNSSSTPASMPESTRLFCNRLFKKP